MHKDIQEIEIDKLYLDQENARYGDYSAHSRKEAIKKMFEIKGMGTKIINIAEHISINGMDPTELPLIFPYLEKDVKLDNGTKYIVAEGNRRLLAIMLLHRPELAPSDAVRKRIEGFTSKEIKKSVSVIQCSVLPTREDTYEWVDLKHTGQNKGVGRVEWDGTATDTFRARRGKAKSVGLQVLEFIEADKDFDKDLKERLNEVDITNLTRFFQSKPAKEALGIAAKKGLLEARVPLDSLRASTEAVIGLMLQDFSVKDVYHDSDRKAFIKRLPKSVLPSEKEQLSEGWKISNFDVKELTTEQKVGKTGRVKRKVSIKSVPSSETRRRLIDFSLKIDNKRINSIYKELKEKLNVHETPNAISVLFRVFLELTSDYFIEKNRVTHKDSGKKLTRDTPFHVKIEQVTNYLEDNKALKSQEAQVLRKLTSAKNPLFSADSLHKLVHASELSPIPTELNLSMDNWAPFLKAIWK